MKAFSVCLIANIYLLQQAHIPALEPWKNTEQEQGHCSQSEYRDRKKERQGAGEGISVRERGKNETP